MYKEIYVENDGHCGQRIVNEYCDPVYKARYSIHLRV